MLFDQPTLEPPRVSEADELYVSPLDLAYERETEWGLFSTDQSIARMLPSAEIKRPRISLTVRIPASRLPPQFLAKRRAGGSSSSGAANAGQAADDASKAAAEEAARRAKEGKATPDCLIYFLLFFMTLTAFVQASLFF
jgi:DMSO/TMAO reductase YedYZ molybdopterin-dependent catalytic subunit